MTNRERIKNAILGRPIDRVPIVSLLGLWTETEQRWLAEGLDPAHPWEEQLGFDAGVFELEDLFSGIRLGLEPFFDEKVLEENDTHRTLVDIYGITKRESKVNSTIAQYLEYPVTGWEDWRRLKAERLDPTSPTRIPEQIDALSERLVREDKFVTLGAYPYGIFGTLRDLMGLEPMAIAMVEEPELIADMADHLVTLWLAVYKRVIRHIRVDSIHMWEDMSGKQGSLISPAMVEAFMLPGYRRIRQFCDENGIEVFSVDTDGDVSQLVPQFISAGVNFMFPFEVAAGNDVREYLQKYPSLGILGGIDKRNLALGYAAINRELTLVADALRYERYLPAPDHAVPPDISLADFKYYMAGLREVCTHPANPLEP